MSAPSSSPTALTPKRSSQRERVAAVLLENGQLSAHHANYQMGITRLASIIWRLRAAGWVIDTRDEGEGMMATYILVMAPDTAGPAAVTPLTLW